MYKQVILIRKDLRLPKGKMAAQASHAAVEAVLKAQKDNKDKVSEWRARGSKKIALFVEDEKELIKFLQMAKDEGLTTSLITDAGLTVIAPGTKTCMAIGPDEEDSIDELTKDLKLV